MEKAAYDCSGLGCGHQPCICPSDRALFPEAHAAVEHPRRPLVIVFRPCARCGEPVGSFPEQSDASVICSRCAGRTEQLDRTVSEARECLADLSPDELERLLLEALASARHDAGAALERLGDAVERAIRQANPPA